jgi:hypothetical protein
MGVRLLALRTDFPPHDELGVHPPRLGDWATGQPYYRATSALQQLIYSFQRIFTHEKSTFNEEF